MVHGSADKGQPQGDIDGFAKAGVLEHGQALVVVHGQHRIVLCQQVRLKGRIRGHRAGEVHALSPSTRMRGASIRYLPIKSSRRMVRVRVRLSAVTARDT